MSWCIKINCEMELNHIFNFTPVQCNPGLQGQPCFCATQQLRIWPPSPPKIRTHWEPEDIERSKKQKIKDGKIKRLIGEEWRGAFCRLFVLREDVLPLVQVSSSIFAAAFWIIYNGQEDHRHPQPCCHHGQSPAGTPRFSPSSMPSHSLSTSRFQWLSQSDINALNSFQGVFSEQPWFLLHNFFMSIVVQVFVAGSVNTCQRKDLRHLSCSCYWCTTFDK